MNIFKLFMPIIIFGGIAMFIFFTMEKEPKNIDTAQNLALIETASGGVLSEAPACMDVDDVLEINDVNSVHGKKDGHIIGYIDLADNADMLFCHDDEIVDTKIKNAVSTALKDWWEADRFADVSDAEIQIITIHDKDAFARSDFNAATEYGVLHYKRDDIGHVVLDGSTLDFSSAR